MKPFIINWEGIIAVIFQSSIIFICVVVYLKKTSPKGLGEGYFARAALEASTTAVNADASFIAISARILRSSSIPDL